MADTTTPIIEDATAWMVDNSISQFVLMPTSGIVYMCMFAYTFVHGCKVFKGTSGPVSKMLIQLIMTCTGGGILVPIFLNGVPVPMANDAYPIAILASFVVHHYFPIITDVAMKSKIVWPLLNIMYETQRASVVVKLTLAASSKIAPTVFSFPLFGPIMCGAIAGCGGAFFPMNKGLDPIATGLKPPMMTSLVGATCFHLYLNTSLSEGVVDAQRKAKVFLALFFILVSLITTLDLSAKPEVKKEELKVKKEK